MASRPRHADVAKTSPWLRIGAPLATGVVLFLVWIIATATSAVPPEVLPPPAKVAEKFAALANSGQLGQATLVTAWEAVLGCLLGAAVGLPLGIAIATWPLISAAVAPYLASSQAIPAIAIAPLLVIWVGYGLLPVVLLCGLLVFFPVTLATALGLRQVDSEVLDAARMDGAHGGSLLRWISWPLALPTVLTGLRNGFTLSITGAVVGEFVMGGHGLGLLLSTQSARADTAGLFASLLTLSALAIICYLTLLSIERKLAQ